MGSTQQARLGDRGCKVDTKRADFNGRTTAEC